jgi:Phage tail tube protein
MAAIGVLSKLGLGAASPVSEAYEFLSESVRAEKTILDTSGIRGTRSHPKERTRIGVYRVGGRIVMQPTPEELANLLPRILGAAAAGQNYDLAEGLPEFFCTVDRVTRVFTYAGCKVVRATFQSSEGQPLELALDIVGKTETVAAAGSFPAIAPGLTAPYVMMDGVLTLLGGSRQFSQFELVIENTPLANRFMNSVTVTDVPIIDRQVTLKTLHPFTAANADLYDQALAGAAGTLAFTNGGYATTFSFANLQSPAISPVVSGRGELMLEVRMTAKKSGATNEVAVAHDATP